jgi:D-alanyl-D-alanine carboxypeptidase
MTLNLPRLLILLLGALVAACSAQVTSPTPDVVCPTPSFASGAPQTASPTAPVDTPTPSLGPIPTLDLSPTIPVTPTDTPGATPPPTLPAGPLADFFAPRLADTLEQQRAALRIPGLEASIIFPDGSRWDVADGFADIGREIPASTDTTFVIGSITKTFVTTATMQLVEEGVLSLDDPLSDFVPDYPNAENITVIELLSHTSGLYDYFQNPDYNLRVFNEPDHEWTPREILNEFVLEPYFAPGTDFHYSNTNFVLAGLVVQAAADEPLPDVLRERFFEPLGLDETWSQAAGPPPTAGSLGCLVQQRGTVCLDDGTTYRPTLAAATVAWGAGDIISTSSDLADWARTLYGGELLAPDSLAMMEDYNFAPASGQSYGLGTRTRLFGASRMFGHTGSLRGFDAAMWYFPDSDLTIVVLTNRGRVDVNPVVDALAAVIQPASLEAANP